MGYKFIVKNITNSAKKSLSTTFGKTFSKPLEISIQPNKRCNARCLMCNFWEEKKDFLEASAIISSLKQLKEWVGGNFFLQIAGGEPLIYNGMFDIFSFCSENDIICKISTNGIALTENICDKIIDSKLSFLSVSLDSHKRDIHDKFRGIDGALDRAVNGIKYLAERSKITLGISSVLMSENIETFPESVDFFLSLPIHRLLIQPVGVWTEDLPVERWSEYKYWINDAKAIDRLVGYLIEKKKSDPRILNTEKDFIEWKEYFANPASMTNKFEKKCGIGYNKLDINYKGEMSLGCSHYGLIGNVKTDLIKKTWYSAKSDKIRKQMMKCKIPCTYNCYKELAFKDKVKKAIVLIKSGLFSKN